MNNKIVVNIAFNTFNFDNFFKSNNITPPRLTKEWIEYRMNIFMNYTCKSLINQTNQDFLAIVYYDPLSSDLIFDTLSKYEKLPENIAFEAISPNYFVGFSKLSSNNILYEYIRESEYVYLTRVDSDDMYHPSFIQQLHDLNIDTSVQCILNQNGYIYDINKDNLGLWSYESPPFYTLVYKVSDFMNGFRYNMPKGHSSALDLNHHILDKRNFMVIAHSKNTSTQFNASFTKGEILDIQEKNTILRDFNLK